MQRGRTLAAPRNGDAVWMWPMICEHLVRDPDVLRLAPTARSRLHCRAASAKPTTTASAAAKQAAAHRAWGLFHKAAKAAMSTAPIAQHIARAHLWREQAHSGA